MRNRAIQVKMVKNDKDETTRSNQSDQFEGKVAIVGHYLENMFGSVGKAVLIYVAADTVRQVMVAKANK